MGQEGSARASSGSLRVPVWPGWSRWRNYTMDQVSEYRPSDFKTKLFISKP